MYYLYDPNDYEYRGSSTQQTENSTTISPFNDGSNTVVGNYFDKEKGIWFNPAPTPSSQDEMLATVTQQIAMLTLANASLTKTVAQLVAGTKGSEG